MNKFASLNQWEKLIGRWIVNDVDLLIMAVVTYIRWVCFAVGLPCYGATSSLAARHLGTRASFKYSSRLGSIGDVKDCGKVVAF